MAARNSLATLIVALLVGLAPIAAQADPIAWGTAEFSSHVELTLGNAALSDEDIVRIVLDGSWEPPVVTWVNLSFGKDDPDGVISSISGEGSPLVRIDFVDVTGPSEGFNPGEQFFSFPVFASVDNQPVTLADLIDVKVTFTFVDDSETESQISLFFRPDSADPENRLTLVPEPETAILLALGLSGLAATGRRRAY